MQCVLIQAHVVINIYLIPAFLSCIGKYRYVRVYYSSAQVREYDIHLIGTSTRVIDYFLVEKVYYIE